MSQIPVLPKDWERWCRKSAITQHYIFYKPERKGEGYCSRCNTRVQGILPKHNQYGICPKCRQRIQYKSKKMQKRIIHKAECTYLLQKFGTNQMVIRKFNVYAKFHQKRDFVPEISWFETRKGNRKKKIFPRQHIIMDNIRMAPIGGESLYMQSTIMILKGIKARYIREPYFL